MKKVICIICVFLMGVGIFSSAFADDKAISFRGFDWYTTKQDVEGQLFSEGASSGGWFSNSNDIYRLSGTDYANVTMGSDRVDGGGIREWYANVSVAGYNPSNTYACYVYAIQDGKIVYDENLAELYFGWYTFESDNFADFDGIFDDLNAKLTNLYGKGKKKATKYNTYITWTDKKKNMIRLYINDNKDYVTLGYIAGDAEKRLDAISKALAKEAKEKEKVEREKNKDNNSGL